MTAGRMGGALLDYCVEIHSRPNDSPLTQPRKSPPGGSVAPGRNLSGPAGRLCGLRVQCGSSLKTLT